MRAAALVLAGALATPCAAQLPASCDADAERVIREVSAATARYADPEVARLEGYRPISYDFPGMGEHWISLRHAVQDRFDPSNPPVLLYARRDGTPVLVGAAFVALRDPGETVPGPEALRHAWHEHNGTLDDELLAGDHRGEHDDSQFAVMVLHTWMVPSLDGGAFDVQNWRLPYIREDLEPSAGGVEAARAVSLLSSADYYRDVLLRTAPVIDDADALGVLIAAARADVGRIVRNDADPASLARAWSDLERRIVERWPAARDALARLSSDPRVHLSCGD